MDIKLSPQRHDGDLWVSKNGDALTLNGDTFDFSALPDGATIPAEAIASDWIIGPVSRVSGELHLTLLLPHGANPPQHVAFPSPVHVTKDGPVEFPK